MRAFLCTVLATVSTLTSAVAADFPARAVPASYIAPVPVISWSGCYAGIEGGGTFGRSQHLQNDPGFASAFAAAGRPFPVGTLETQRFSTSGGLAGGTVGCSYQFSRLIIGLENDFSWTNTAGTGAVTAVGYNLGAIAQTRQHWLGTFRGRIGTAWDRWLIYATGGGAITQSAFTIGNPPFAPAGTSKNIVGWTVGAGVEYALTPSLSAKVEYLYTDFGSNAYPRVYDVFGAYDARKIKLDANIVRAGLNYRINLFAAAPVVARY